MRRRKRKGSDEKLLSYENYVVNGKLNQVPPTFNALDSINTQISNYTNFDNREVVSDKTYDDIVNNYRGQWSRVFGNNNPIHVEVGSGRGKFITTLALKNPDINYIALEIKEEVLIRGVEKVFDKNISNIKFLWGEVEFFEHYFSDNELDRIYINFCDPWPKKRNSKRRLTSEKFLELYRKKLNSKPSSGIHFKTDNQGLFEFSLNEMSENRWTFKNISLNLVKSDFSKENVTTEYEEKFMELGMPIYRLEAYTL